MVSQGRGIFHDWLWLSLNFSVGLHACGQTFGWTRPYSLGHLNYKAVTLLVTTSVAQGGLRGLKPLTTIVEGAQPLHF